MGEIGLSLKVFLQKGKIHNSSDAKVKIFENYEYKGSENLHFGAVA